VTTSGARGASAACCGFGFARNTAATFDVFYWLEVTNFDVPLFDPSPNGLDYIDVWDFWIHAKMPSQLFPSHRFPEPQRILFRRRRGKLHS
jgi:hypothetical protein